MSDLEIPVPCPSILYFLNLTTEDQRKARDSSVEQMGKFCCGESDDGGLDLTGVVMAIIIALAIMAVCMPPSRQPTLYAVYRCRSCCGSPCRC
ncbi:hypothetical protein SLEP1_g210 [Rubroshorea leprosula]|uniref:Uncharacterized protein n=1 Tax=Rubroshorea leprosula TaxID=152421 RepID=A0AAV5HIG7_9ROSI|nr:hypothetical protein SLEP1_g210 [Rubroshorea leprosula]